MLNGKPIATPKVETAVVTPASSESQTVGTIAGLVSIILAIALPPAGAIVGGIALNQAKQGGYRNPLAKAGLIVGIVLSVLIVVIIAVSVVFSFSFYNELIQISS